MATGSQNLTTYYAKRIIGDASAASSNAALLQTGTGVTADTWILNRTNRATDYGIIYNYDYINSTEGDADKIEFVGKSVVTAWVRLDTGDFYVAGKVGIGYNPNTSGNTYKLYVDGTAYFNNNVRHNGWIYFADGSTYYVNDSGTANLYGLTVNSSATFKAGVLIRNNKNWPMIVFQGNNNTKDMGYFTITRSDPGDGDLYNASHHEFVVYSYNSSTKARLDYRELYALPTVTADLTGDKSYSILTTKNTVTTAQGGTGNTSYTANRLVWTETATKFTAGYHYASSTKVGICYTSEPSYNFAVSGTSYFNGNTTHNGIDYFANGTTYYINNSANANLNSIYANSITGYSGVGFISSTAGNPWPSIRFDTRAGGTDYITTAQTAWAQIYATLPAKRASDNHYYSTRFFFRQYSKTANTTTRLGYYEDYYLPNTTDGRTASVSYDIRTSKSSAYNVDTATHLSSAPNNTTTFYRGDKTWTNVLGGAFQANGTITANGGYLKSTLNSNTVTIGSANGSWCHIENSANIPFYFNKAVHVNGDVYYYNTKVHMSSTGFHPPKNGGIYWDPYIESASDASDVSRIIQVASGCAGGTELQIYQANDATDCINLVTPKSIYLNSKEAFNVNDSWLRINENKKFTSGVYFGSSLVRTDGTLRAGTGSGSWTDVTAGVVVSRIDSGEARLEARNGTHRVYLYCNSDGRAGLYGVRTDGTAHSLIAFANNSSTGTFYGNCTGSSASCTGNAATATKATQDGSGNTITSTYLKLAGGTMTGALNLKNNTWNNVGDDCAMGDCNQSGLIGIKSLNNASRSGFYFYNSSGTALATLAATGSNLITVSNDLQATGYLQAGTYVYIGAGYHIQMRYNNAWWSTVFNHNNGNISLNAAGGGLYVGYLNTTSINWLNGKATLDSNGIFYPAKVDIRPGTHGWAVQIGANQWGGTGICNGTADNTGNGSGNLSIASWYGIIFEDGTNWTTKAGINCRTGVYYGKGFSNTSSILVKENIKSLSEDKARQILLTRPVSFDYKKEFSGMKGQFGLIAEELEEILPELVEQPTDKKGYKHIDYTRIIPFLIKLAQSQQKEIDELKHQIKYLIN